MEPDSTHCQGFSMLNSETIEQLRQYWKEFISGLEMTPTELQLSKARAERALDLARRNQNKRLVKASSPSKYNRPLTALYSSPRTTCRMKKILDKQVVRPTGIEVVRPTGIEAPQDERHYFLCPQCGLVKEHRLTHEKHAKQMRQRLKWLVAKHPNLQPNSQRYLL